MERLERTELLLINGGCASSNDPDVQAGLNIGCAIGRAIGSTIRNFGDIMRSLNPFKKG